MTQQNSGLKPAVMTNLLLFGRTCRMFGMEITPDNSIDAARSLRLIDLQSREDVYHTLRTLYVKRQHDLALFARIFDAFWGHLRFEIEPNAPMKNGHQKPSPSMSFTDNTPAVTDSELLSLISTYSQQENLRQKDFAEMSADELALAYEMIAQLNWSAGVRKSHRFISGRGQQIDLRRAFRHNLRYAGEWLELPRRQRKIKRRSLVVLGDISGSMERYTYMLLHLMYGLLQHFYQVEAFVFSTRLTRITPLMRNRRIDGALSEIGKSVIDWSGGTRIGDALHTFNYCWRWRSAGTSAIVLLISDGWDRGDPEVLRRETALLQRGCHRLIWLNPLLGIPDYQPLTRGAQAMIDYVDDFLPVHNLASLETLVHELGRLDGRQRKQRSEKIHV